MRDGIFEFGGITYELLRNLPPHSAHGVGFTSVWAVLDAQTIACDLGSPWPFGGRATQRFELSGHELLITMTVTADQDMPVMMGWHPWFTRYLGAGPEPVEAVLSFGQPAMYDLDSAAIPTGALVAMPPGPWDNCFLAPEENPRIVWPGTIQLQLSSSCDHWVVYTAPDHALCVEPQTDAPDVFNRSPTILRAGESTSEWFRLRWD